MDVLSSQDLGIYTVHLGQQCGLDDLWKAVRRRSWRLSDAIHAVAVDGAVGVGSVAGAKVRYLESTRTGKEQALQCNPALSFRGNLAGR